ncbi:hypothetical protein K491DRAFT_403316 [Lophiostoma macrostomum CBS 122681]|uniref:Uncharacterized protein n=1 Tax=Lophiostoma macrostomum CBS 122681 TaxID=1314788 RepID=A0A6A6T7R8_9PLEO|nr:hypothetical protein K491DRAFT_403316 [Lophiostoma macrostomum CBS 122681]
MNRSDSGFEESHFVRNHRGSSSSSPGHNVTSSTSPKSTIASSKSPTISEATEPNVPQQTSDTSSCTQRRSRDQGRKSMQSSTNTSTKSRDRCYSSKPSSRRTLVDPSRPGRHYRVKSSQSVPTVNRDIDDVLALHFRSCSLFQSSTFHSQPDDSEPKDDDAGSINDSPVFHAVTCPTPRYLSDAINPISLNGGPPNGGASADVVENMTTHWMSPCTRRREYENIDRAHSGVRGLVRRVLPRSVSGPSPRAFYEKDKSDVGSVRRYRMDMSDDDDEVDEKDVEKHTSLLRHGGLKVEPARPKTGEPKVKVQTKGKRWGCF